MIIKFDNLPTFDLFESTQSYGCVMIYLKFPQLEQFQSQIDSNDLADDGLEHNPHVTVIYGLHDNAITPAEVFNICKTYFINTIELCGISKFDDNPNYDVIKFDVSNENSQLQLLHDKFKEFPNTQTYPHYHPHVTIAYVKKGVEFINKVGPFPLFVEIDKIVYSAANGLEYSKKLSDI